MARSSQDSYENFPAMQLVIPLRSPIDVATKGSRFGSIVVASGLTGANRHEEGSLRTTTKTFGAKALEIASLTLRQVAASAT
ncbi:unnamed protein product [Calypogeia fissa]